MKKVVPLLLLLSITSCFYDFNNGIKVGVTNNSGETIRNIAFTTSEEVAGVAIDSILPNTTANTYLSMRKNKTDGAYMLHFTRNDKSKETVIAGYYSNGNALNYRVDYIVERDTVVVDFDASDH